MADVTVNIAISLVSYKSWLTTSYIATALASDNGTPLIVNNEFGPDQEDAFSKITPRTMGGRSPNVRRCSGFFTFSPPKHLKLLIFFTIFRINRLFNVRRPATHRTSSFHSGNRRTCLARIPDSVLQPVP